MTLVPPAPTLPIIKDRILCGANNAFAKFTVSNRLPVILTKCIDQLHKEMQETNSNETEMKRIIGFISNVKYEMTHDKELKRVPESSKQALLWNYAIDNASGWYDSPWLFIECLVVSCGELMAVQIRPSCL